MMMIIVVVIIIIIINDNNNNTPPSTRRSLQPLRPLSGLQTLNASLNQLTSLEGAQGLTDIQQLDVTDNALPGKPSALAGYAVFASSKNSILSSHVLIPHVSFTQSPPISSPTHCIPLSFPGIRPQSGFLSLTPVTGLGVTGPCSTLAFLDRLNIMRGNPLAKVMNCRLHLVHLLPQVRAAECPQQ